MENLAYRAFSQVSAGQLRQACRPRAGSGTAGRPVGRHHGEGNGLVPIITERLASQIERYAAEQNGAEIDVEVIITTPDAELILEVLLTELMASVAATMRREGWS